MRKKIIICAIPLLLFLLILPIYFGITDNTPSGLFASRGSWHGHIYVNEFIGIQFEMPPTWFKYTEEELASMSGIGATMIAEQGDEHFPSNRPLLVNDMSARDIFTGSSVLITTEAISPADERAGEMRFLRDSAKLLNELSNTFHNVQIAKEPRYLGGSDWYYITNELFTGRVQMYLVSINSGFNRRITISADSFQEIEEIWELFTKMDSQFENTVGTIPTMENSVPAVSRGVWEGRVYTNPTLGLRFTAPSHYHIFPDSDIAMVTGVPLSFFEGDLISNELWIKVNQTDFTVTCMGARAGSTNAFVNLFVQRVPLGIRNFPVDRYLQISLESQRMALEQSGFDTQVITFSDMIEISGHEWQFGRVTRSAPGIHTRTDVLMTVVGSNIWIMFIGSGNDLELQEILSMFSQY